jgi:hypothetical protein
MVAWRKSAEIVSASPEMRLNMRFRVADFGKRGIAAGRDLGFNSARSDPSRC